MLPDRVSNPGPLTYESGALPIALRGPAFTLMIFAGLLVVILVVIASEHFLKTFLYTVFRNITRLLPPHRSS